MFKQPSVRARPVVPGIAEDPFGVALGILELAESQRPDECRQSDTAEAKRDRDQEGQDFHAGFFQSRSRKAFNVTVIELRDIASAAISGVTIPATANGTATAL